MRVTVKEFPCGIIRVPASKSTSHRALICAALGGGSVKGISFSADIEATLRCIKALGGVYIKEGDTVSMITPIWGPQDGTVLDCGESGSTLRFFLPLALSYGKKVIFTGHGRLLERPLGPYAAALRSHGVTLEKTPQGIVGSGQLQAGEYWLPGDVSSQFVSGLLFALPFLKGESTIRLTTPLESRGYVDLTLEALAHGGVSIHNDHDTYSIIGGQQVRCVDYQMEGDWSAAAFLLAAAVLGRPVAIAGLKQNSAQGDREICELLQRAGVRFLWKDGLLWTDTPKQLKAFDVRVTDVPDLVPPLAAVMAFCEGESHITGAARLRMKESDRLKTVHETLETLGAHVKEGEDSLTIVGKPHIKGGTVEAQNDHRIAMMAAVAAIRSEKEVTVTGAECVSKSWPGFWKDFCSLKGEAE